MKVYFVGAGPGDPELITVKGQKIIKEADLIIYAGSLVNPILLDVAKDEAEIYDSAAMTLEEVLAKMEEAISEDKLVARVHTGDPSIYGAIQEQMDALEDKGIEYEVIPGVSSFVATAASLKREYTLPDVTQTVIVTRLEGRTSVPDKEKLHKLARHNASMAIFLSVHMIENVVKELAEEYSEDTPIAVVQKASWHDEKKVVGTLATIADKVKEAEITKTAMIVVGDFLDTEYSKSKLYDKDFSHEYRKSKSESN
ncbi:MULTISPECIES: precorrin-4 C(11)-methyltransferase [unclassified Candidatus Frackibacter]|uniref:precorrin-4 C(11)-methyltransferase n=1 Tax=unclassified Candidatus Frackibacter TaxID=2648818 RepID=UPI0007976818|nr:MULTISPECIES: precorrin-4 C(11)-methyltransferase [unclassified Candidatus Frackibacter]KXS43886.1 MAG: precorrin-4 C11-methyltransferase [Candidatus Frackibacter sp. T328-2]SDC33906.1 cobalt-precorrin 4 C11-methyltransferase [Candidatus Frackibacter sp. WG11]SEM57284.1 cobalt-precorrin 4 C11-methyltransferase [Candidatus Frackibacter sp. WG12]SFL69982.1 cobalt-precorrin 4 C11-methyltransferase [Candidatus Frackibacter sp. WG13]